MLTANVIGREKKMQHTKKIISGTINMSSGLQVEQEVALSKINTDFRR